MSSLEHIKEEIRRALDWSRSSAEMEREDGWRETAMYYEGMAEGYKHVIELIEEEEK